MGRNGLLGQRCGGTFFFMLEKERVHQTGYAIKRHARKDIIRYIEGSYNGRRRNERSVTDAPTKSTGASSNKPWKGEHSTNWAVQNAPGNPIRQLL